MQKFESDLRDFFVGRQSGSGERFDSEKHPGSLSLNSLEKIWELVTGAGGRPETFVDVGSGFGLPLAFFAEKVNECVGVEVNPRVAAECEKRLEEMGIKNWHLFVKDLRELDLETFFGPADLVLCNDMLFDDEAAEAFREAVFSSFDSSPESRRGWIFTSRPLVTHARFAWDEPRWEMPHQKDLQVPRFRRILRRSTKINVKEGRLWGGEGQHFPREMILYAAELKGGGLPRVRPTNSGAALLRKFVHYGAFPRSFGALEGLRGDYVGTPKTPEDLLLASTFEEAAAGLKIGCHVLGTSPDCFGLPATRVGSELTVIYSDCDCDVEWMYPSDGSSCSFGRVQKLYLHRLIPSV